MGCFRIFPSAVPILRIRPFSQPVLLVVGILLAAFAYRDLLLFEPTRAIPDPVERMLFEPADTTPALIVMLALWLLWRRRERWRGLPARGGPLALTLPLLAAGAGILVWARLTGAHDLLAVSLLAAGLGLASLWKGAAGVRLLLLPAGFLLFALPLPPAFSNAVIFRFQLWTAGLVGWLLYLFALPAHVVAESILRSDFTFSVVEGCSGLRSVVTLSMLSVLMVDLFRRRGLHAAILVLAAPLVAFGLNAVRAIALILNPHSTLAAVHIAQGVAILLCGLILLYALDGLLARFAVTVRAEPAPPPALGFASLRASHAGERRRAPAKLGATLLVLALFAGLSVAVPPWVSHEPVPLALPYRFDRQIGEWTASPLETDRLFLGSVSFRESLSLRYQQDGETVDLFLGIGDRAQRFSSPLSPKTERPGSGWTVEERGRASLDGDGAGDVAALVERSATRQLLVYHWVDGSAHPSKEALRSLLALDATPWPQIRDPLVVRLSTEIGGPDAEGRRLAEARLQRFWASLRVDLEKLIHDMEHFSNHSRRKGFS
jgi:EpsI family protein